VRIEELGFGVSGECDAAAVAAPRLAGSEWCLLSWERECWAVEPIIAGTVLAGLKAEVNAAAVAKNRIVGLLGPIIRPKRQNKTSRTSPLSSAVGQTGLTDILKAYNESGQNLW